MPKNNDTLIIIPAFNESKYLPEVITEIRGFQPLVTILVIDDGSTDNTYYIAKELGCVVLRHVFNLGDGAARHTGYIYAALKGYDFVIQIDADGQHNPGYIDKLLEPLKNDSADIVIGSRFIEKTEYMPTLAKKIGMFLFNSIATFVTKIKITDSTSGFRAVNKKVINFHSSGNYYPTNFPDADLIILSHFAGFRIKEVFTPMRPNRKPQPLHHGLGIIYYVFKMLLSITVTVLREKPKGAENL